jgi:hypothetical protein
LTPIATSAAVATSVTIANTATSNTAALCDIATCFIAVTVAIGRNGRNSVGLSIVEHHIQMRAMHNLEYEEGKPAATT